MKIARRPSGVSVKITGVRSLVESDLEYLRQKSVTTTRVQSLRDSHHNVARLIASGLKLYEVAEATGYSYQRIWVLSKDPSVVELIAHYRDQATALWRENIDHMQAMAVKNMIAAERQLSDKLDAADEAGELLPTRELLAITSDRMDRFGYGKKNMNLNVNVDFAAKLEAAIARTKKVAAE